MKTNKELVIGLIKDNLVNMKLVLGLNNLGLVADDYYLKLGDTIFKLMGFKSSKQSDLIFEKIFVVNTEKVSHIEFSDEELTRLSLEIYQELEFAKEICEGKQE